MAHWRACTPCIYVGYHSRFYWSADHGHLAKADEEERHEKGDADGGVHLARPVVHVPRDAQARSAATPAGRAQWGGLLSLTERGRRAQTSHHAHRSGCDQSLRARWKNVSFLREASPAGATPRSPALSLSFVSSLSFSSALSSAAACIWCPRICWSLNIQYELRLRT